MNKKYFFSSCLSMFVLAATSTWADTPAPADCPPPATIVAQGLTIVDRDDEDSAYVVGALNNYATPQTWAFGVLVSYSITNDKSEAMRLAIQELPTLSGDPVPTGYVDEGKMRWGCIYRINKYVAAAVTPVDMSVMARSPAVKAVL